jgi:UDP-sugar transporter A1/2/3
VYDRVPPSARATMFATYGESKHRGAKHPSVSFTMEEDGGSNSVDATSSSMASSPHVPHGTGVLLRVPPASKRVGNHTVLAALFLAILAVENTASMLARRYAVGVLKLSFSKNAVLFVNELLKAGVSVAMELRRVREGDGGKEGRGSPQQGFGTGPGTSKKLTAHLKNVLRRSPRMAVPAVVYLVVNLISYPALARVNASVFTAISQLKVLATAFFATTMLGTKVSWRKWRTLAVMVLGVVLVSWESAPTATATLSARANANAAATAVSPEYLLGVACAGAQTVLSGFGSIYFELVLKQKGTMSSVVSGKETTATPYSFSVWDANIQLALWSVLMYFPMAWLETGGAIFRGWTPLVWCITCLHASGGILVALSVLYTSSVTKTVAVCGSLVLTAVLGRAFFDAPLNGAVAIGCAVVVLSVVGYKDDCEVDDALAGQRHARGVRAAGR